ncbi:MAG TPA: hypothetical protein VF867_19630 [Arthrobacter sp.]
MRGFDQLSHATHSPVFALVWLIIEVVVDGCIFADLIRHYAVRGTRRHYVLTTVVRTLSVPAILVKMTDIVLDSADRDYFGVSMDVIVTMFLFLNWYRSKDDDNWWKGRGKKLGRWVCKQFLPRSSPAVRPA